MAGGSNSLVALLAFLLSYDAVSCSEVMQFEAVDTKGLSETESERIILGTPASNGQFPWSVALRYKGSFICTASIVSSTTILTAAHCVNILDNGNAAGAASDFSGIIGSVFRFTLLGGTEIKFSSATVHPGYNPQTIANDIAFFKTSSKISFSNNVKSVSIARNVKPDEIKKGTVMGWGRWNDLPGSQPSVILKYAELDVKPLDECKKIYGDYVTEKHICGNAIIRNVCNGDSGGPFVHLDREKPFQIGITSFGIRICANIIGNSGVFTRVASFADWLIQTSQDTEINVYP